MLYQDVKMLREGYLMGQALVSVQHPFHVSIVFLVPELWQVGNPAKIFIPFPWKFGCDIRFALDAPRHAEPTFSIRVDTSSLLSTMILFWRSGLRRSRFDHLCWTGVGVCLWCSFFESFWVLVSSYSKRLPCVWPSRPYRT